MKGLRPQTSTHLTPVRLVMRCFKGFLGLGTGVFLGAGCGRCSF